MKKITILIPVLLLVKTLIAAQSIQAQSKTKDDEIKVDIHFSNGFAYDELETYVWDTWNLEGYQRSFKSKVTGNRYHIKLKANKPVYLGFEADTNSLFHSLKAYSARHGFIAEPGDELHMEIGKHLDMGILNIRFIGKGAGKYRCMQELIRQVNGKSKTRKWAFWLDTEQLFARADSDRVTVAQVMGKYKNQLSSLAFKVIELAYLQGIYSSAIDKLGDSSDRKLLNKYADKISALKAKFTKIEAGYDKSNLTFLYRLAVLEQMINQPDAPGLGYYRTHFKDAYLLLKRSYADSPALNEILLATNIFDTVAASGISNDAKACMADLLSFANKSGVLYKQILAIQQQYQTNFESGSDAYDFALPDTSGKTVRLADFRGKLIIMDFFFYGCGGCITTAPVLDSLEKLYGDKEIVFIAISVDGTKKLWQKGIGIYSSKNAVQLYTNGLAANHPLIKYYRVGSYPTIVIIDKEGKLISAHAPDPRSAVGWKEFTSVLERSL
ncbi:TlpA family protein disulfide reductase [Mucilaginibacter sp. Mucisp86]|uniref:TlpA family protein disulfide reductase n=1 Tax=Mucilaginibacter sp. Mucisp86 TaxID=3243060 RepID=UPI0039B426D5